MSLNLDQQWTYLEADTVCGSCGKLWTDDCACPDREKISGGQGYLVTMTEREILAHYYEYWRGQMIRADKLDLICAENCIQDWIVVNWAAKGGKEAFQKESADGK